MASPRGNRWLYKLKTGLVAHVVERMHEAFPGHTICLVDGADLASRIDKAYETSRVTQKNPELGPCPATLDRIQQTYGTPIPRFTRGESVRLNGVRFYPLIVTGSSAPIARRPEIIRGEVLEQG